MLCRDRGGRRASPRHRRPTLLRSPAERHAGPRLEPRLGTRRAHGLALSVLVPVSRIAPHDRSWPPSPFRDASRAGQRPSARSLTSSIVRTSCSPKTRSPMSCHVRNALVVTHQDMILDRTPAYFPSAEAGTVRDHDGAHLRRRRRSGVLLRARPAGSGRRRTGRRVEDVRRAAGNESHRIRQARRPSRLGLADEYGPARSRFS